MCRRRAEFLAPAADPVHQALIVELDLIGERDEYRHLQPTRVAPCLRAPRLDERLRALAPLAHELDHRAEIEGNLPEPSSCARLWISRSSWRASFSELPNIAAFLLSPRYG